MRLKRPKSLKHFKKLTRRKMYSSFFPAKNRYYLILTFQMLRIEHNFVFVRLPKTEKPVLIRLYQRKIKEKLKKISASILGKI